MDDALRMRVLKGSAHLAGNAHDLLDSGRAKFVEGGALHPLHHDERNPRDLARIIDRDDIRMV